MWGLCLLSAALALTAAAVTPDPVIKTNKRQLHLVRPTAELVGFKKVQTMREAGVAGLGAGEIKGLMLRERKGEREMVEVKEVVGEEEREFVEGETRRGCPNGWHGYQNRCFFFVPTHRTWAESEKYCESMNANLASVHSIKEDFFIQDVIRQHTNSSPLTWIGGCDAAQENLWLWSNGWRFDFTNWHQGEPNNSRKQHCLLVNYAAWDDYSCSGTFPSVCARRI